MKVGDKTLAGDMNFDPLMIADSPEKLAWYREAEVTHGRVAMTAVLGFLVAENFHPLFGEWFGVEIV